MIVQATVSKVLRMMAAAFKSAQCIKIFFNKVEYGEVIGFLAVSTITYRFANLAFPNVF